MHVEPLSERNEGEFLVCYLDLLGYKPLVNEYHENKAVISGIEKAFKEVLSCNEGLRTREANTPFALANKIAAEHTAVALISDSMLIRMPMPESLPRLSDGLDDSLNAYCYVVAFLLCVSNFYRWIAGTTRHFFRGAVTKGQYYERNPVSSGNLFVFSKALVTAVELAEKKGAPPMILLDKSVIDYLECLTAQVPGDQRMEMTRREQERVYLDVYFPLNLQVNLQHPATTALLKDIVKAVTWQVGWNEQRQDVVEKYRWFAGYHNLRMKELGIEDQGLTINLPVGT